MFRTFMLPGWFGSLTAPGSQGIHLASLGPAPGPGLARRPWASCPTPLVPTKMTANGTIAGKIFGMSKLLQGKTAIVLGVWNKWSIAHAIAQAFSREGAKLLLTYQNDRAKPTVEELGKELGADGFYPCDVQQQPDIDGLAASLKTEGRKLDVVVHCLAGANHEDLNQPFSSTSRDGFNLALDISAYSLVSISKALAPLMTDGGPIMTLTSLS